MRRFCNYCDQWVDAGSHDEGCPVYLADRAGSTWRARLRMRLLRIRLVRIAVAHYDAEVARLKREGRWRHRRRG